MEPFIKQALGWAWIPVTFFAVLTAFLTLVKIKGKVIFRIGFALLRGIIFFGLLYPALINQPRLIHIAIIPVIGIVFFVLGLFLVVWGAGELMKTDLKGAKGVPEKLITSGPYAVIRHPLNLGLLFAFPGWYLIWAGVYSLAVPVILDVVLVTETFWEERNLQKAMPGEYEEYKKRVGMFFPKSNHP